MDKLRRRKNKEVDLQGCESGCAPGAGAMDEMTVSTNKIGLSVEDALVDLQLVGKENFKLSEYWGPELLAKFPDADLPVCVDVYTQHQL